MSKEKKKDTAYFACYLIWCFILMFPAGISPAIYAAESSCIDQDDPTNNPDDPMADFNHEIIIDGIASIEEMPSEIKRAERRFHDIVVAAADEYDVEIAMIKAIIMAESGYDPYAVSKKGAMGLMQLMPPTARAMGIGRDPFNPEKNIQGGTKYFKQLLEQFSGRVTLALAAYNAGSGNVMKYRGIPPFKVTRHYIAKVLTYYEYYKKEELV